MPKRKTPRTIPNPDYEKSEEYREKVYARAAFGFPPEDYLPGDFDKQIPPEGAWILLLMEIRCGKSLGEGRFETITVPRYSIWFALPNVTTERMHQGIIQTPQGAVHIWPHEYTICDISKFLEFSEEQGFYTRFLSDTNAFDEAALFYLRSRGIGKAEAQRMLLATLKDPYYCYFEFDPAYLEAFTENTGTPYLSQTNHDRRRANHAAKR